MKSGYLMFSLGTEDKIITQQTKLFVNILTL